MAHDANEEMDITGDSIKIFVRVRPPAFEKDDNICIKVTSKSSLTLMSKSNPRQFDFDHVADHFSQQETVFASIGKRIVESCVEGYNGTIFAYGQTGSGKTYTMLGPDEENSQNFDDLHRGIIPRCLEYLFQLIEKKQYMHGDQFEFMCKVSFLEIYNEQIFDLLDQASTRPLHLRESQSHGVFVAGIIEKTASNEAEAYNTLLEGWSNRSVASTSMNRESSRSHAVFSLTVELKQHIGGMTKIRQSVLNLVDLAGSERQTDTHASGLQLREAGSINKSLSVLGQVIMALDDIAHKKQRHIPYRNSKLTFLLRDSLGGNAKTSIIINVHPNSRFFGETLSTLQFAQRAKAIRNRARINENTEGDIVELQNEIRRLRQLINNNNGLSSLLLNDSKISDSSLEYRTKFFVAVQMREWQQKLLVSYKEQLTKLKKSNSTLGLIIKYRNSYIACLKNETPVSQDTRNKELEEEIEALKQQLANHPEVAAFLTKVTALQNEIDRLKLVASVQGNVKISEDCEMQLEKSYIEILKEMNEDESKLDSSRLLSHNCSLVNEGDDKRKLMESEQKLSSIEEELSNKKETNATLEAELKSSKSQISELENVLKAMQAGSAIERKRMNYMHDLTIKTITTPRRGTATSHRLFSDSTPAKSRKRGEVLFPENDSSPVVDDIFDVSADVSLLQDVSMPYCPDDEAVQDGLHMELQEARDNVEILRKESCDKDCKIIALQKSESFLKDQLETYKKYLNEEKTKIAQGEIVSSEYKVKFETAERELRNLQPLLQSLEKERKEMQNNLEIMQADFAKKNSALEDKWSKLQLNCSNINAEKEELLQRYQTTIVEVENLRAELDFIKERQSEAEELLKQERKNSSRIQKQLEEAADKLSYEKETSTMLREQLEGDNLHVSEALASLQSDNMDLEKTIQVMKEGAESLERDLEACRADLIKAIQSKDQNKKTILAFMNQVTELRGTVSMQELANSGLHADLDEVNAKLTETSNELDEEREKHERIAKELWEQKENIKILSSKHNFDMENLQEDLQGWITQHEEMTAGMTRKEELLENAKREIIALEEKIKTIENEAYARENNLKQHLGSMMSEERRQREADEERKTYEYETLQKNFDEIIGKYNNLRTRTGLIQMELQESKEENVLAAKNHMKQLTEIQDKLSKEYQEAHVAELQELKNAIESAEENNKQSKAKIAQLVNQLEETKRELGEMKQEESRQNENMERFKESEEKRFTELRELRLQLEKEQIVNRQVEKHMEEINGEKENLSQQLAKLAGHNNHHQKIQYLVKMKEKCSTLEFENSQLKQDKSQLIFELQKFNRPERSPGGILSTRNSNK